MEFLQPAQIIGIAWYREKDYPCILNIMADSHVLPASFKRWEKIAEQHEREIKASGRTVIRAIINPKEFEGWCAMRGLNVDARARTTFANECAYRHGRR